MLISFIKAIIEGFGLGLTLAILTGPAFFALLQTSIHNGYKSGIAFAIGVFFSDSFLILLAYFGALQLFNNPKNDIIVGMIGGTILIVFGIFNIFQKHPLNIEDNEEENSYPKNINLQLAALKGFAINIINPFVIIFWIGVVGVESARYEFSHIHIIILFSSTLITILSTDILKSMAANKITSFLKPNILIWINRLAGVILVISGVSLIMKVV
ncbi:MAG: LysE family transporter [Bacteroidota bacterium]